MSTVARICLLVLAALVGFADCAFYNLYSDSGCNNQLYHVALPISFAALPIQTPGYMIAQQYPTYNTTAMAFCNTTNITTFTVASWMGSAAQQVLGNANPAGSSVSYAYFNQSLYNISTPMYQYVSGTATTEMCSPVVACSSGFVPPNYNYTVNYSAPINLPCINASIIIDCGISQAQASSSSSAAAPVTNVSSTSSSSIASVNISSSSSFSAIVISSLSSSPSRSSSSSPFVIYNYSSSSSSSTGNDASKPTVTSMITIVVGAVVIIIIAAQSV